MKTLTLVILFFSFTLYCTARPTLAEMDLVTFNNCIELIKKDSTAINLKEMSLLYSDSEDYVFDSPEMEKLESSINDRLRSERKGVEFKIKPMLYYEKTNLSDAVNLSSVFIVVDVDGFKNRAQTIDSLFLYSFVINSDGIKILKRIPIKNKEEGIERIPF